MYKKVAIAGTFDHLHKGHRFFISKAFESGEKVVIGLTSNSFVRNKYLISKFKFLMNAKIFNERKRELEEFLKKKGLFTRVEIVEISDIYGPTLKEIDIEALVVTKETREGAEKINRRRQELKLSELKTIEVPLILAWDKIRISSTRIRMGEIDRWGKVFEHLKIFGTKIDEKLRQKLKKPLGILIGGEADIIKEMLKKILQNNQNNLIISVGDEITGYLNKLGEQADISIVDFYINRIKIHENLTDLKFARKFLEAKYTDKVINTVNPAGNITSQAVKAVKRGLTALIKDGRKRVIIVEGEEDLIALPAILLAPLNTLVLYGQPDEGVVAVEVTEEKKREIVEMIDKIYTTNI